MWPVLRWLRWIATELLDLIYPEYCCHCRKFGAVLCDECFAECEFLLTQPVIRIEPCYLDGVQAALNYKGPITSVIKAVKYQSVRAGGELGGALIQHTLQLPTVDAVMAVPLHRHRLRERGFNQAELIAQSLAQAAGLRYFAGLARVVNSRHQASLHSRELRLTHQQGHFVALAKPSDFVPSTAGHEQQASVLLVDDVLTTGSTLNECARVLKAAGWARVYGVTLAHGQS